MKLGKLIISAHSIMVIYEAVRHETDTHDFKSKTEFNVQAKIPFPSWYSL